MASSSRQPASDASEVSSSQGNNGPIPTMRVTGKTIEIVGGDSGRITFSNIIGCVDLLNGEEYIDFVPDFDKFLEETFALSQIGNVMFKDVEYDKMAKGVMCAHLVDKLIMKSMFSYVMEGRGLEKRDRMKEFKRGIPNYGVYAKYGLEMLGKIFPKSSDIYKYMERHTEIPRAAAEPPIVENAIEIGRQRMREELERVRKEDEKKAKLKKFLLENNIDEAQFESLTVPCSEATYAYFHRSNGKK